jgi:acyl-CoA thioesterase YciA
MELITTTIMKKSDEGVHGNIFGGTLMSLIDDSASYAAQICDTERIVTIKIDELIFKSPVKVGSLLKIYGKVEKFGTTSIKLYIEVRKHNVHTGKQEAVTQTYITFVRIDGDGKAIPIYQHVKDRYYERYEKHGKGLLSLDEKHNND